MRTRIITTYRGIFGLLGLCTFAYLLASLWGNPGFRLSNLLSYFTVQSNVLGAVVLLVGAVKVWQPDSARFDLIRGAATLYLLGTGVVFELLLSDYEGIAEMMPPGTNLVMHQLMPLVMAVDWLFDPPRSRIRPVRAWPWLLYPLAYLVYSLIRGPIADWYPYPFLDPEVSGGYVGVAGWSVLITVFFLALTLLIIWVGNRLSTGNRVPATEGRQPVG